MNRNMVAKKCGGGNGIHLRGQANADGARWRTARLALMAGTGGADECDRSSRCGFDPRPHLNVPATDDYCRANEIGRQYAADFAQYLKQNPCLVGSCVVGDIIRDMAQDRRVDATYGYGVGFFAFLEKLIYIAAKHADLYAIAEREAQHYAVIKASEAAGESA